MKIENRIVCFIDVLGFSDLIEKFELTGNNEIVTLIRDTFDKSLTVLKNAVRNSNGEDAGFKFQAFSDNIMISIPYEDNEKSILFHFNIIAVFARLFQFSIASKGLFTRGGISFGKYYSDENIIFSKALLQAYKLESKVAIYPRIIVDDALINRLMNYNKLALKSYKMDEYICFDWENKAFLNFYSSLDLTEQWAEFLNDDEVIKDKGIIGKANQIIKDSNGFFDKRIMDRDFMKAKTLEVINSDKKSINKHILNSLTDDDLSPAIKSKYIWLLEFIKWYDNDRTAKLKFEKFADRLNNKFN